MMKIIFTKILTVFVIALLGLSCASQEKKEVCPTVEEEPISVCRAKAQCKSENSSVGVGMGLGFGNFGFGVGSGKSTDRYTNCLDRDLKEQKEKSQAMPRTDG